MKKAKKLLVLLLSAVMCLSFGFSMIGVSAATEPKYYDWDGKEIVWTFDANGVSTQNLYLSGGNFDYFGMGSYQETLSWYNNRYQNAE